jgi:GAF domain-containing protein
MSLDARSEAVRLADLLLAEVERIAERHVARMRELLPSYAEVPSEKLLPAALNITRNLLEAVCDPEADPARAERYFRVLAETRIDQGIAGDEMLQAWRILLEVVREEAHPVADRVGIADDALLEFVEATLQWGDVGMRKTASAYRKAELRELERLAAEQAALRRVATMVARECPPNEVFAKVAEELNDLLEVTFVRMVRFEPDGTATVLAAQETAQELLPVGMNLVIPGGSVMDQVLRTGEPARLEDFPRFEGPIGHLWRQDSVLWAAGGPIIFGGRLWGALVVGSSSRKSSAGAEQRVTQFAQLVSTAFANIESRAEVERLAAEQAALRRVATMVARESAPNEVFAKVTEEFSRLQGDLMVRTVRFEPDGTFTILAAQGGLEDLLAPGTNTAPTEGGVCEQVFHTGRPGRVDDYALVTGQLSAALREEGIRSAVAGPIIVDGRTWGAMAVLSHRALPPRTEDGVAQFAELVSTAISNVESRAKVERLAVEQSALRRVATLAVGGAPPTAVFEAVVAEMQQLLRAGAVTLVRYEPGDEVTFLAHRGPGGELIPPGARASQAGGESATAIVRRTKRPARHVHAEGAPGALAAIANEMGFRSSVGVPLVVEGNLWGCIVASWGNDAEPPVGTEERMARFAQLLATAIANADSREALRKLADEQAALRRVATLVAEGAPPSAVFETVTFETLALMGVDSARLLRYEPDGTATFLAERNAGDKPVLVGTRLTLEGDSVTARVLATRRSCRINDLREAEGAIAEIAHERGERAAVGAPIMVEGRLWGVLVAMWSRPEPPPEEAEARINEFAQLVATAMANADSNDQLTASRARLLTEADEARRRVVRDLHDGAQQRLLQTIVTLGLAQRRLSRAVSTP